MKKLLLSLSTVIFFFTNVNAQLVADAGPDQTIFACSTNSVTLGGTPTATGGTPPYTYLWTPNFFGTLSCSNCPNPVIDSLGFTTTFNVHVTDALGDTANDIVVISSAGNTLNLSIHASDTCAGNAINFTSAVTGGSPPYNYQWNFGDGGNSNTSNAQHVYNTMGFYHITFTVTDGIGCQFSGNLDLNIFQNCSGFNTISQNPLCFGSCNGTATVSPPAGNYRYQWSNSDTSQTATGLCAGTYSVTVMDSVLTSLDTLSVTITQPTQLFAAASSIPVTCFGSMNGAIILTSSGGTPPYTYLWSNGSVTQVQQNLPAGTYVVTVIDANNCSASAVGVVTEPTPIILGNPVITNESLPGACDGSIVIPVNGGTPAYSFNWSNASVSPVISGLCPGNYSVTISDANGCTATNGGVVAAACPNNTLVVSITSTGDIDCNRSADTLTAVVTGGTPPYYYWWTNVSSTQSTIVTQAGIYDCWVTDSAGCSRTAHDTVQNLGLVVSLLTATPLACNGVSNGKIKVAVSGGTAPYTYLWSNGATADSIVGIPSATYTLTVTDAALCSTTFSYFLNQGSTNWSYYVYVNSTTANCASNGTATAYVQGGTAPFTYLWNTTPPQTTQTATGLTAGTYSVSVTGSDGCTRIGQTYIYTSCYNILQGRIINDLNGNCVLDSGETPLANHSVIADGSNDSYGYTDTLGYYSIRVLAGTYTVRPYFYSVCIAACSLQNVSYTQTFPALGDTVNNLNFYLVQAPFDLYTYQGWTAFRPGFTRTVYLYYGNVGTDTVNGTLTFTYDADLTFVSAANGGVHNASNRTITWTFADIAPNPNSNYYYYYYYNYVSADFLTPIGTPVGTSIINRAVITGPTPECDTANNIYVATTVVTNSQDPNDKSVMPARDIYDESDSLLTYTIRFQNTGTDTAWFVVLKDTLSSYLNPATVQNIASSHPITEFTVSGTGILTWVFNPIYLVDSFTNEEASHGYVMFRIKKKSGLLIGTEIKNTAHIYFDYNEAVVTNTVTSKVADPNFIFTVRGDDNISVAAMPNPFTQTTQIFTEGINSAFDFELFDVTGKLMKKLSAINENRFELKRDDMSAGVYFYRITTLAKQRAYGRVVVE